MGQFEMLTWLPLRGICCARIGCLKWQQVVRIYDRHVAPHKTHRNTKPQKNDFVPNLNENNNKRRREKRDREPRFFGIIRLCFVQDMEQQKKTHPSFKHRPVYLKNVRTPFRESGTAPWQEPSPTKSLVPWREHLMKERAEAESTESRDSGGNEKWKRREAHNTETGA